MQEKSYRYTIKKEHVDAVLATLKHDIAERFEKHGYGAAVSSHEILGVITEEHSELIDAVKTNDWFRIIHECTDIAVAALFGIMSHVAVGKNLEITGENNGNAKGSV